MMSSDFEKLSSELRDDIQDNLDDIRGKDPQVALANLIDCIVRVQCKLEPVHTIKLTAEIKAATLADARDKLDQYREAAARSEVDAVGDVLIAEVQP